MPEKLSSVERSINMSRVKGRGNKATEIRLIKIFRSSAITGWRRGYPIFGKPDFVFLKHKLAVFVDGCFWHSCPRHRSQPVNNLEFWKEKLERNRSRDRAVNKRLEREGWIVLRIWQHELSRANEERLMRRIRRLLNS